MEFTSVFFLSAFLPVVFAAHWGLKAIVRSTADNSAPRCAASNLLLVLSSIVFCGWINPYSAAWLAGSVVVNHYLALALIARTGRRVRRALLAVIIFANLLVLAVFKYNGLFYSAANSILGLELKAPYWTLPLGISFYTFQAISYAVDVFRGSIAPTGSLLDYACYLASFPRLIAGPIARYSDVAASIAHREFSIVNIGGGLCRLLFGLGKKAILADTLGLLADSVWGLAEQHHAMPPLMAAIGVIAYSLQIYFDFSGYTDMAIGLGAMFGFRLPENFAYPYAATSIRDFWRRWHISLSTWFRDYLYIPLGGNRKGLLRTIINGFVVFGLCGLWHGSSLLFLLWGLWHGLFLTIERFLPHRAKDAPPRSAAARFALGVLGHAYTTIVFALGWVIFRSHSIGTIKCLVRSLLGLDAPVREARALWLDITPAIQSAIICGIVLSLPIVPACSRLLRKILPTGLFYVIKYIIATAVGILAIVFIAGNSCRPALYAAF